MDKENQRVTRRIKYPRIHTFLRWIGNVRAAKTENQTMGGWRS
jgi:hypothetical protein